MSFTNQTQHYGLPQYIGSDVPAYLTDYNGAMATIDQGMNAAKTQADNAATAAGQAANDIASLTATVGTQAAQISAAAQAASTAQTTANTADGKADALDVRVTNLEQGTGLTYTLTEFQAPATTISGSLNRSIVDISAAIPQGKTLNDVLSITVVAGSLFFGGATGTNAVFYAPVSLPAGAITLGIIFK